MVDTSADTEDDEISLASIDVQRDLLDVKFIMKSDVDPEDIVYYLELKDWTPVDIDVEITFKDPQLISMGEERDVVFLTFKDPEMFRTAENDEPIVNQVLKKTLPRQLPKGLVAKLMEEQAGGISDVLGAIVIIIICM